MDDSEKLTALKKAYADIILNTAKEAAARIMVSERKALRFQQELVSTKEEALRMLLRLKQMFDSKVKEAELTSLSQQSKIDVLEAQLQEAEEIVRDLRAELREAQSELENLTNHQMHPPVATQENCLQENRLDPYDGSVHLVPGSQVESVSISDPRNPNVNGADDSSKFCVSHDHTNNCHIQNPDFASIVIRRKEPELYRNGCTQRIRAFERSLFDGNMSVSGNLDNVQDETLVRVHEEGKAVPVTTNAKVDTLCEKEKPDELKAVEADADLVKVPVCEKRRINIRRGGGRGRGPRFHRNSVRVRKTNKASYHSGVKGSPCVLDNNDPLRVISSMLCENEALKYLVRVHEEGKTMPVTTNAKADTLCEKEKPDELKAVKADADPVKVPVCENRRIDIRRGRGRTRRGARFHWNSVRVRKTNKASCASCLSDAKASLLEAQKDLVRLHEEGKTMPVTTNAKADNICEKEKPDELKAVKADADPVKVPVCENRRIDIRRGRGRTRRGARFHWNSVRVRKTNKASCASCLSDAKASLLEAQKDLVRLHEEGKTMPVTTNAKADNICEKEIPDKLKVVKASSDSEGSPCVLDNNEPSRVNSSMVPENEAQKDLMSPFAKVPIDETAIIEQSGSHDDIEKGKAFLNACSALNKIKDDKELFDKSDLTRQESLDVPACRADVEEANGSSDKLDQKTSDLHEKVSRQSANDKFLKYTFQRKRKKESVSSADCSLENSSLKKKCGEKQNGHAEPQKSCPMTESSRDSRRLAQVARQLISLSEKKWWQ